VWQGTQTCNSRAALACSPPHRFQPNLVRKCTKLKSGAPFPVNAAILHKRPSIAIIVGFVGIIPRQHKEYIMATKAKKNPRLASGRKRARQNVKLNAANTSLRSKYRTVVKNVEKAVLAGDKVKATELFAKMQAVVDSIADKGIFHKNKAARDKSRLSAKVKALATAA
jgi:small subunit ribosomal protein S20